MHVNFGMKRDTSIGFPMISPSWPCNKASLASHRPWFRRGRVAADKEDLAGEKAKLLKAQERWLGRGTMSVHGTMYDVAVGHNLELVSPW